MWDKTDRAITFLPSLNGCDGRERGSSRGADGEVKAALGYLFIAHFNKMGWNQPCLPLYPRFNCGKTNECSFTWEGTHHRWKNLLQDNGTVKNEKRTLPFILFFLVFFGFFFPQVKNSVVMLPDCKSEYNNASALPGERNIRLFTALLCPKKRLEKQPVSLARWDPGPKWLQCEAQLSERGDMQRQRGITVNCSPQPPHGCMNSTAPRRWCRGAWNQWTPVGVVTRTSI